MKKNQTLAIQAVSRHYSEATSIARWELLESNATELGQYLDQDAPERSVTDTVMLLRMNTLLLLLLDTEAGLYEWDADGRFHEGKGGSERDCAQAQRDAFMLLANTHLKIAGYIPLEEPENESTLLLDQLVLGNTTEAFLLRLDKTAAEALRLEVAAGLVDEEEESTETSEEEVSTEASK